MDQSQWDELYAGTELVWTAEANRFVVEELAGLTAGRALDLGTGEGRNAIWLAERGWQVTAVDFSAVSSTVAIGASSVSPGNLAQIPRGV